MSWWTNFRDAALVGAGLKKGGNAARTLGNITRPTFQNATQPVPAYVAPVRPVPVPGLSNSVSTFMRDNKWAAVVLAAGGGLLLYRAGKIK